VRAIPGVISAGSINLIPFTNFANATFYLLEGQPRAPVSGQVALIRNVSRDYFATVGAQLREGRSFSTSDQKSDAPVAIVNEPFANRHFPDQSPLGRRFKFGALGDKGYWYTIVGVVRQIREAASWKVKPAVYRVHEQCDQIGDLNSGIVVRTTVEPSSIVAAVRQAVWSLDRNQPLARIQTMEAIVDRQLSTPSQSTAFVGRIRCARAAAGVAGNLRRAFLRRHTAHQRDRRADGAGCDIRRDPAVVWQRRGLGLTLVRPRDWRRAGGNHLAPADDSALRLPPELPPNCRRRFPDPCGGGSVWHVFFPRAAPRASIR